MRMAARFISGIFGGAAIVLLAATNAFACACCTNTAWRYVEIEKLEGAKFAEITQVKFAKDAKLMLGEASEGIKGVDDPDEDYKLSVAQQKNRWIFSLKDTKGRGGNLTLTMPKMISIFEVDPRDAKDAGYGPPLYKEWKLNANAARDGVFRATTGANQKMTLIFHGRGTGCTDAGVVVQKFPLSSRRVLKGTSEPKPHQNHKLLVSLGIRSSL